MNPELTQRQMQILKDFQASMGQSMSKVQSDVDTAVFTVLSQLSQCCIELTTCCMSLCAGLASLGPVVPPPPTAMSLASTSQSESVAFAAAMPAISDVVQKLPGQLDNAITGALKQIQAAMAKLQFASEPDELSDPASEDDALRPAERVEGK